MTTTVHHPLFARLWVAMSSHETDHLRRLRAENLAGLSGRVLEIGAGAGTNFVTLYRQPSFNAELATDIGEHPDGAASTWRVDDHSARATAGQRLVVSGTHGRWVQVSWAGESAWLHNPRTSPVLVKTMDHLFVDDKGANRQVSISSSAAGRSPVSATATATWRCCSTLRSITRAPASA